MFFIDAVLALYEMHQRPLAQFDNALSSILVLGGFLLHTYLENIETLIQAILFIPIYMTSRDLSVKLRKFIQLI